MAGMLSEMRCYCGTRIFSSSPLVMTQRDGRVFELFGVHLTCMNCMRKYLHDPKAGFSMYPILGSEASHICGVLDRYMTEFLEKSGATVTP